MIGRDVSEVVGFWLIGGSEASGVECVSFEVFAFDGDICGFSVSDIGECESNEKCSFGFEHLGGDGCFVDEGL